MDKRSGSSVSLGSSMASERRMEPQVRCAGVGVVRASAVWRRSAVRGGVNEIGRRRATE